MRRHGLNRISPAAAAPNSPLLAYLNRISGQSTISEQPAARLPQPDLRPVDHLRPAQPGAQVGRTCDWDANGILGHLSDNQWRQLITSGSALNNAWRARLAEVVPFLRQLRSAGVEALWRLIHEMNEGWSWWVG